MNEPFEITASEVARGSGVIAETVRLYATLGLLDCQRLGNGTRLFQRSAIQRAKTLREERIANRGRRPAA